MAGRMAVTANAIFTERDPRSGETLYQCVAVHEDEPGYEVLNRGWHSLRKARAHAASVNERNGITEQDVLEVISSSLQETTMYVHHLQAKTA